MEHVFKDLLALSPSLDAFMHVEVEDAEWFDLFDLSSLVADEEFPLANFE